MMAKKQSTLFSVADAVSEVIEHYRTYHPRFKARATGSAEGTKIRQRLADGYTVEDLKLAIDGNHKSEFHNGANKDNKQYHDLGLIVRSASNVARFMGYAESPTKRDLTVAEQARAAVMREEGESNVRRDRDRSRLYGPMYDALGEDEQVALAVSEGMSVAMAKKLFGLRKRLAMLAMEKREAAR